MVVHHNGEAWAFVLGVTNPSDATGPPCQFISGRSLPFAEIFNLHGQFRLFKECTAVHVAMIFQSSAHSQQDMIYLEDA